MRSTIATITHHRITLHRITHWQCLESRRNGIKVVQSADHVQYEMSYGHTVIWIVYPVQVQVYKYASMHTLISHVSYALD